VSWLNRPYPLIESNRLKTFLVLGFGLFTYLFLIVYKPFRAVEIGDHQVWFLFGFGISVSIALSITYFIIPNIFKNIFQQEHWQIKKEILYLMLSLAVTSILNYTYNETIGGLIDAPKYSLLEYFGITFSVGIFPIIFLIFLVELFLSRRNSAEAKALLGQLPPTKITSKPEEFLIIQSDTTKSPVLKIAPNDFILARSDNNYITLFYLEDDEFKRQLFRLSMKKLEGQCLKTKFIIRCHRSYMINKNRIKKIEGNARSLVVKLEHYLEDVPVSRSFDKEQLL
jgi:hypothetical protein